MALRTKSGNIPSRVGTTNNTFRTDNSYHWFTSIDYYDGSEYDVVRCSAIASADGTSQPYLFMLHATGGIAGGECGHLELKHPDLASGSYLSLMIVASTGAVQWTTVTNANKAADVTEMQSTYNGQGSYRFKVEQTINGTAYTRWLACNSYTLSLETSGDVAHANFDGLRPVNLCEVTAVDADGGYTGANPVYVVKEYTMSSGLHPSEEVCSFDMSKLANADADFFRWTKDAYFDPDDTSAYSSSISLTASSANFTIYANYYRHLFTKSGTDYDSIIQTFHKCANNTATQQYLPANTISGANIWAGETVYIKLKHYYNGYTYELSGMTLSYTNPTTNQATQFTVTAATDSGFTAKGCNDKIVSFTMPNADVTIESIQFTKTPQAAVSTAVTAVAYVNYGSGASSVTANYGDKLTLSASVAPIIDPIYLETDMPYSMPSTTSYTISYQWYLKEPNSSEFTAVEGATNAAYSQTFKFSGENAAYTYRCVCVQTRDDNGQSATGNSNDVTVTTGKGVYTQWYCAHINDSDMSLWIGTYDMTVANGSVKLWANNISYGVNSGYIPIEHTVTRPGTYSNTYCWYEVKDGGDVALGAFASSSDLLLTVANLTDGTHTYYMVSRQTRTDITTNTNNYIDERTDNNVTLTVVKGMVTAIGSINNGTAATDLTANQGDSLTLTGTVSAHDGYTASCQWYRKLDDGTYESFGQAGTGIDLTKPVNDGLNKTQFKSGHVLSYYVVVTFTKGADIYTVSSNEISVTIDKVINTLPFWAHINNSDTTLWAGTTNMSITEGGVRLWANSTNYGSSESDIPLTWVLEGAGNYVYTYYWYEGDTLLAAPSTNSNIYLTDISFGTHSYRCVVRQTLTDITTNSNNYVDTDAGTVTVTVTPGVINLGAQAKNDGSAIRFGMRVSFESLKLGLDDGDSFKLGFCLNAKSKLENLTPVTMTGAEDGTQTVVILDLIWSETYEDMTTEEFVTVLRGMGCKIFDYNETSFTLAVTVTGMSNAQEMDIAFRPFMNVTQDYFATQKYNNIKRILSAYNGMGDGSSIVFE